MHALRQHLLAEPGGRDLHRGRRTQIQTSLCGDAVEAVAEQIHPGLQIGHPQPQRLMLEQRGAELLALHHPRVRDAERALARRRDLTGHRHAFVRESPRDRGQSGARPRDQVVGGHPGVDVDGGGVQRRGADLAPRGLHLHL